MKMFIRFNCALFVLALVLLSACDVDLSRDESTDELEIVEEVWVLIHEEFVDIADVADSELAEAAIRGMIEALEDPYTAYLDPKENAISSTELEGDFSGIGAIITMKNERLMVVAPIEGSPAEKAGILPGDEILEVDGEPVTNLTLIETTLLIRGEGGTAVSLLILHKADDIPVTLDIIRDRIEVPSVKYEMLDDDIAHIMVTNFSNRTAEEFRSALTEVGGAKGIILDMRANPGGAVNAAVSVVSQFVDEGIVVYALDNEGERDEWPVENGGVALEVPLVILVDSYSASASEVVAGALQDHDRGVVIGEVTYGKGKMSLVNELSNGGALYVTFARWFTPLGRQIDGEGIIPDILVAISPEDIENDRDPQLERSIEYLVQSR